MKVIATRDFAHIKAGDAFSILKAPDASDINPDYLEFAGKWITRPKGSHGKITEYIVVEDDMWKPMPPPLPVTIDEVMAQPVVVVKGGVQDDSDFLHDLGLSESDFDWNKLDEFEKVFQSHFFKRWLCTDTNVGYGYVTMNGERIALFRQSGRKMDCTFLFNDDETVKRVREVVRQFIIIDESYYTSTITDKTDFRGWLTESDEYGED